MKGFQQIGTSKYIYAPTQIFGGFIKNIFSENQNPYIVDDNLYAWWDTQNGITLNSSASTVAAWTDKINGYTFTQGIATSQPTYNASDSNYRGYPSISFSGSNLMAAGNILNIGTLAGFTVILVSASYNNVRSSFMKGSNASPNVGSWSISYATPQNQVGYKDATSSYSLTTCNTGNINTIVGLTIDRTKGVMTSYASSNGGGIFPIATANISTTLTNLNSGDQLYLNAINASYGGGVVVLEIIAYTRALTQAEINQNVRALKSKYGIWTTI